MSVQFNSVNGTQTNPADFNVQETNKGITVDNQGGVIPAIINVKEKGDGVPALPAPAKHVDEINAQAVTTAVASLSATVLSVLTKELARARRENANEMFADSMAQSKNLQDQSAEIRSSAKTRMILGIVSGSVTIAASAASMGVAGFKLKGALTDVKNSVSAASQAASQATEAAQNAASAAEKALGKAQHNFDRALIDGLSLAGQGASKIIDAVGQNVDAKREATIKEYEAKNRELEAMKQQLDHIHNSLNDTIRKAFETQSEAARSQNAAMSRMFG